MKRTHEASRATDTGTAAGANDEHEQYTLNTLDILYEYVRQSGLYNMCFPMDEARSAFAAILAVGVYLGQPLDWDYLVSNPHWPSRVQQAYTRYHDFPRLVREAAAALPGGETFRATASFGLTTPRMRLSQREIVREAVAECLRWAQQDAVDHDEEAIIQCHYKGVLKGAQMLDHKHELAPTVVNKKASLGTFYMQVEQEKD